MRILIILLAFSLLSFSTQTEKKITITFTEAEVGLVYTGLGKLPAEQVEQLRAKVAFEYQKQTDTTKKK
jgi:hypothetical protein